MADLPSGAGLLHNGGPSVAARPPADRTAAVGRTSGVGSSSRSASDAGDGRASVGATHDVSAVVHGLSQELGQKEFLRVSLVLCKILQNAISFGSEQPLYRRVRLGSPNAQHLSLPGVVNFLLLSGFKRDSEDATLSLVDPLPLELLEASKQRMLATRRRYDAVEALEVPEKSLKLGQRIGKGKFGEVYGGHWDRQPVAIKTLRPKCDEHAVREFHREAHVMRPLNHSNIVSLLAVALTVEPSYIVLDLMRGCFLDSLHDGAATSPGEQLEYAFQVAAGMDYLHHHDVVHCDLAARNILISTEGVLKISDFGLARPATSKECHVGGKPGKFPTRWTAPEVFSEGILSKASDIWSYGILFYEFVTGGAMPYGAMTNADTKLQVAAGYRLPQPTGCPDEFHAIMLKCWARQAKSRPGFGAVVADLAKDRQKFVSGTLHFRRHPANDEGRARSSSPGSSGSVSSVDSTSNTWTDGPPALTSTLGHSITPPSQSPSPQLRHEKDKRAKSKLKKFTFGRSSGDLLKGDSVVCVYTVLVSPIQPSVVVPLKDKHRSSELVAMVMKRLGKSSADTSKYALVELKGGSSTSLSSSSLGGSRDKLGMEKVMPSFQSRFIIDSERPLSIKATWPSQHSCHFVLCSSHGNNNSILSVINEHFSTAGNASILHQQCRGYLLTFQELRGGSRMAGRSKVENWERYWCLVNGSAMLMYRDEDTEENSEEPTTHVLLEHSNTEPAADVSKKRDVLRVCTAQGDTHLLRTCGKDDMYRWLEALSTASTAPPSVVLEKFGDGEILHTGYLQIDEGPCLGGGPSLSTTGSRTSSRSSLTSASSSNADRDPLPYQRGRSQPSIASEPSAGLPSIKGNPVNRRLLCVLKGRQLLAFFGSTRRELVDFANVVAISVLNPTSLLNWSLSQTSSGDASSQDRVVSAGFDDDDECLMTFGIQIDVKSPSASAKAGESGVVRYFLKPDTPGDLDAWTDALDRLLLKLGKNDLMVPVGSEAAAASVDETDAGAASSSHLPTVAVIPEERDPSVPAAGGVAVATDKAFVRDMHGGDGARRSIRRRPESGFTVVAKLRKTAQAVDERIVYDEDSCPPPPAQSSTAPATAARSKTPSSVATETTILSPVSEQGGGAGVGGGMSPPVSHLLKSMQSMSPSKVSQLKALVTAVGRNLDNDDVLSPTHSHHSVAKRSSSTSSASSLTTPTGSASPQSASPSKHVSPGASPRQPGKSPVPVPTDGRKTSPPVTPKRQTAAPPPPTALAPAEGDSPATAAATTAAAAKALAPSSGKPVPSPRTSRRSKTSIDAVVGGHSTGTDGGTLSSSSHGTAASDDITAIRVAGETDENTAGGGSSPAVPPPKRPLPPVSPKPTRRMMIKPSPPVPIRSSTSKLMAAPQPSDKEPGAAAAAAAGLDQESGLGPTPSPPPPLPADSPDSEQLPPRPPLPMEDAVSSDEQLNGSSPSPPPPPLPADNDNDDGDGDHDDHLSAASPPPPLPPDNPSPSGRRGSPAVHVSPPPLSPSPTTTDEGQPSYNYRTIERSASLANTSPSTSPPPPLPQKTRRSGSAHDAMISATLPRHLPRGQSLDYPSASSSSSSMMSSPSRASSASTDNLRHTSASPPPLLPPKISPRRVMSSSGSGSLHNSREQLDIVEEGEQQQQQHHYQQHQQSQQQQHQLFQKSSSYGNLVASSSGTEHFRQKSSPANMVRVDATPQYPRYQQHHHHQQQQQQQHMLPGSHRHPVASTMHSSDVREEYVAMAVGDMAVGESTADEYIDMNIGGGGGGGGDPHQADEYVEMADHSLPTETLLDMQASFAARRSSPLKQSASHTTLSSTSTAGGGGDDYIPMSPLDSDAFLQQHYASSSSSATSPRHNHHLLSAASSVDSETSGAVVAGDYMDMAPEDASVPYGGAGSGHAHGRSPMTSSPRHMSMPAIQVRPQHQQQLAAASALGSQHRHGYASIADNPGDNLRPSVRIGAGGSGGGGGRNQHPYASIADDPPAVAADADSTPPPLPSRLVPPGAGGAGATATKSGLRTLSPLANRHATAPVMQPKIQDPSARSRTESVPNTGLASLFHGRRSAAVASKSNPSAGSQLEPPGMRARAATVSVSSTESTAADGASGKSKSKTKKKTKTKDKEPERLVLPKDWQVSLDESGDTIFTQPSTGRTAWSYDAMTTLYKNSLLPAPPPPKGKSDKDPGPGWKAKQVALGKCYYHHKKKQMSTWIVSDTWH